MTVLDASAIIAVLQREVGADVVTAAIPGGVISAATLAEIFGKVVDAGKNPRRVWELLDAAGIVVEPVLAVDAELAGAMRAIPHGRTLSLGDRLCLALAVRSDPPEVLTADRIWRKLGLPITVRLIR